MLKGLSDMVKRKRGTANPKPGADAVAALMPVAAVAVDAPAPAVAADPVESITRKATAKPKRVTNRTVRRLSKPKVQQELLLMMSRTGDCSTAATHHNAQSE